MLSSRLRHPALSGLLRRTLLTHSAVEGPRHPPLETRTLWAYFSDAILEKHSTRPALVCREESINAHAGPPSRNLDRPHLAWDFEEFHRHILALARGLLALGVQKGDRVAVLMGNNSSYAMLQWACSSIGAVLVTLNPAYRVNELISTLKLVGAKHLFVVPCIRTSSYLKILSDTLPGLKNSQPGNIQDEALPELRNLIVVDNQEIYRKETDQLGIKSLVDWRDIFLWKEDNQEHKMQKYISQSLLHNDDVINLQFTSGTTGAPKAVSLTHTNLLNNGIFIARCMHLSEKDILCNVPPLFHCFDNRTNPDIVPTSRLVLGNLAAWSHGACIVYASEIFNPTAIVDAVTEERCTALHGVPTHFLGVLAEVNKRKASGQKLDFSRLRTGIAAGSSIPIDMMKDLISQLHLVDLTNAYGMTETSPVSFQTTPADPVLKRVETVGKVHPHVRAKLVDPQGNIVPVNTPGELCVAGYLLQKGYWEDEEHTRQVMRTDPEDGGTLWMHTGDEGIMDEEGYLRIVGRRKDIIIRGGENLFPVQIENALTAHPDIQEAAAVAVPDPQYGEVVGAWIVRTSGTKMTREEVRRTVVQAMNPQNAPTWVWFVGEDHPEQLPKTASGKVMKHVLRDWSGDLAKSNVGRANRET